MAIRIDVIQPYLEMPVGSNSRDLSGDLPTVYLGLQRLITAVLVHLAIHDIRSLGNAFAHAVHGGKCIHLRTVFE